jgi:hypothetical protein
MFALASVNIGVVDAAAVEKGLGLKDPIFTSPKTILSPMMMPLLAVPVVLPPPLFLHLLLRPTWVSLMHLSFWFLGTIYNPPFASTFAGMQHPKESDRESTA